MSFFNNVPLLPEDPILGLPIMFNADKRHSKINLGVGAYKTAEGNSLVLNSVRKSEHLLLQQKLNKDYLPIEGDPEFIQSSMRLLFGNESSLLTSKLYFTAQTVGGAGALRIAGELLSKISNKMIFLPQPTWANHKQIFERSGLNVGSYPYYHPSTFSLDFEGICSAINNMEAGSIILLHGCCHNPTGIDPSFDQWKELSALIKNKRVIPLFDMAYQGFGVNLDEDAQSIRYFSEEGHEMFVAYSFSKNFGLYGERVGFLTISCSKKEQILTLASQIKCSIRGNYSNPPLHGSRIVSTILKSDELFDEWKNELVHMQERITEMRKSLIGGLLVRGYHENIAHMSNQKGLFCFTGLKPEQVLLLRNKYAIYLPIDGRINIGSLNTKNMAEVTQAIMSVLT